MTEDVLTTKLCSDQTVLTLCICQLSYIAVGMGSVMGQLGKGLVEGNKLTFDYFFSYNFFLYPFLIPCILVISVPCKPLEGQKKTFPKSPILLLLALTFVKVLFSQ